MKKIEQALKHVLLRILLLFASGTKAKGNKSITEDSKLLFIRLNRIGDALVMTPLLKIVKDTFNPHVYVLADRKNSFVFKNNPSIDKLVVFEKGISGFFKVLRFIKQENIDILIDMHDDVSTTVTYLCALAKVNQKFALEKSNRIVYTKTIEKPDPSNVHIVDRMLRIGRLLGLNTTCDDANICYYPSDNSFAEAKEYFTSKFSSQNFVAGINISAGSQARFWGIENFRKLLNMLQNSGISVLVLCSERDIEQAREIAGNNEDMIFHSPSFEVFSAVISQLSILITPDTSVVHIASCYNIPVFGLYVKYNTNDMIWSPYRSEFDYVVTTEPELKAISYIEAESKLKPFLRKLLDRNK